MNITTPARSSRPARLVPVLLATAVLIGGAHLSAEAVGSGAKKPVLAGKVTKAGKTTTIKTTGNGPALKLKTKAGSPPLAVTSRVRVGRLNADQVDGFDAADLATQTSVYRLPEGGTNATSQEVSFPGLPAGTYVMSYSATLAGSAAISSAACFVLQDGAPDVVGLGYGVSRGGSFATASGSGPVDSAIGELTFVCNSSTSFSFDDTDGRGSVTFTRTTLVDRDAVPSPRTARPSKADKDSASGS